MARKVVVVAPGAAKVTNAPYSTAIKAGEYVFISGQIPLDPATGKLAGDDIETQTRQVLKNLEAVLGVCECGFHSVVKTTMFLSDLNNFAAVNKIYAEHFSFEPPARSTVQVARLPMDSLVEIEAIAIIPHLETNPEKKAF